MSSSSTLEYSDALKRFKNDDYLNRFLEDNFDANANIFCGISINNQIEFVKHGIESLNQEILSLKSINSNDIKDEWAKIERLEAMVNMLCDRISHLQHDVDNLRTRLTDPFKKIAHRILLLNRLQNTLDLLRKLMRIVHLSNRIQSNGLKINDPKEAPPPREVLKLAQQLTELNELIKSDDRLKQIDIIAKDLSIIYNIQENIIDIANIMLNNNQNKQDLNIIKAFKISLNP